MPTPTPTATSVLRPAKARNFLDLAMDHGWVGSFVPQVATDGTVYVGVRVIRDDQELRLSWRIRTIGTYRLESCLVRDGAHGWRDSTLTKARALLTSPLITTEES